MIDSFPVLFVECLGALVFALLIYGVVVIGIRKVVVERERRRWIRQIGGNP